MYNRLSDRGLQTYKIAYQAALHTSPQPDMCDTSNILQSSALFWTLSLIPRKIFPYLALGVLSASTVIYALYQNLPSARLCQINNAIAIVEETLTHAKAKCMRDYSVLVEAEIRFLR
jgi:hypothetical protein